jgi:hypothetical protein
MSEYTVRHVRDCIVIEGAVPIDDFCGLVSAWERRGEDMIVDALLSAKLGVNFVIGPKVACNEWRAMVGIDTASNEAKE